MDKGKFCATFDLEESQILKRVSTELLEGADGMKSLTAQLYKLNVYGMSLVVNRGCDAYCSPLQAKTLSLNHIRTLHAAQRCSHPSL